MTLALRRNGGSGLTRLQDEMSDLFGRFFGDRDLMWSGQRFWPAINVAEKEDAISVEVEIPGCKAEDIELSVHGNSLTIKGEKKERSEEKKENYYHQESRYGSFHREVILPSEVDPDKVQAKCLEGVLTITMPKAEKAKAKKIKIEE